jgi:putative ABC transport system permease protein
MAAIAISLFGSNLPWRERLLIAWFGAKGFASVVYGPMLLEVGTPQSTHAATVVALTGVLSMLTYCSTDVLLGQWLKGKTKGHPAPWKPPSVPAASAPETTALRRNSAPPARRRKSRRSPLPSDVVSFRQREGHLASGVIVLDGISPSPFLRGLPRASWKAYMGASIDTMLQNLRVSIRTLARNPGMTITVLLTLAIGIGANTAIFTMDYATLLAPLPYPHPNQLVMVWSRIQNFHNGVSAGDYLDWKRQSTAFQDLCAWSGQSFNIATKDQPDYVEGNEETYSMIQMIGAPLMMGRYFLPEEGVEGRNHVAIIAHKLWQRLGANSHIIGSTLRINDQPYTVVGVQRPGIYDRMPAQITVPLVFKPEQINHDFHWLLVMGRLKPGVTIQQAQQNMDAVTAHIAQMYPKSDEGWGAYVDPLKNDFMPKERIKMLWLLLGSVGFVLLIACVNVANLLLARGVVRQKELAVRTALGARRSTIFAQLLTESLLLSLAGGALGVGFGYAMLRGLIAAMPQGTLPAEADLRLNIPILLFTFAVATFSGLLAGCAPAWYASRIDPGETLKESARTGTGSGKQRLRRVLVVGESALALTLLAGAGLAIHSFWNLAHVDLGLRPDHVLTFFLPVPESRPKDAKTITAYYRDILAHIDAVPGVQHVSAETGLPLYGAGFGMPFTLEGGPTYADRSKRPNTAFGMVTPDFFKTFGIQVQSGRSFTDQDTAASVPVAMVNQEFVKKYLQGKNPLHQRVLVEELIPGVTKLGPPIAWQIVGTFHDVHTADQRERDPEMLIPFMQIPWPQAGFGVRTAEDPATMVQSIAAAVHAVDPAVALARPRTLEQDVDESMASERFTLVLFSCFAGIALFLAALGIYGVMSFSVAQRAHEIALRMALGASRHRVVALIVRDGLILAAIGTAIGLVGAYFVGRAMHSLLFGVGALDLTAFSSVAALLLITAVLACFLPARRAASVEPMRVLRTE